MKNINFNCTLTPMCVCAVLYQTVAQLINNSFSAFHGVSVLINFRVITKGFPLVIVIMLVLTKHIIFCSNNVIGQAL